MYEDGKVYVGESPDLPIRTPALKRMLKDMMKLAVELGLKK